MTKKNKVKYKGNFNYYGECYTLFTQAYSRLQAIRNFIHKLHRQTNIPIIHLRYYFMGKENSVNIQEVT